MGEAASAILFACTYNTVRSPMAEALLKHFHGLRLWVQSVGVHKGEPDPFAAAAMDEIGIDISRHRPKSFAELDDSSYDLVIPLSPEAQHHAVEMTRTMACAVEFWNIFDPSLVEGSRDRRLDAYRQVRDELERRILARFPLASHTD